MQTLRYVITIFAATSSLTGCSTVETSHSSTGIQPTATANRPMDEVPAQKTLGSGDRQYGFENGCLIVLEPKRAVVRSEGAGCQPHHRDIALLYASGD